MLKGIVYGLLGIGAAGALSICDLCKTSVLSASVVTPASVITAQADTAVVKTVTLKIDGMTCGGCAVGARKVLTRLDGVKKADVSYEKSQAVVTYDSQKVTVDQMIAAIKKLGYTASVVTS